MCVCVFFTHTNIYIYDEACPQNVIFLLICFKLFSIKLEVQETIKWEHNKLPIHSISIFI